MRLDLKDAGHGWPGASRLTRASSLVYANDVIHTRARDVVKDHRTINWRKRLESDSHHHSNPHLPARRSREDYFQARNARSNALRKAAPLNPTESALQPARDNVGPDDDEINIRRQVHAYCGRQKFCSKAPLRLTSSRRCN